MSSKIYSTQKNYRGKLLIDYVIESNDDKNLLTFFNSRLADQQNRAKTDYFLKLLHHQYQSSTQTSIFEFYLKVRAKDVKFGQKTSMRSGEELGDDFFQLIFLLLEELQTVDDIETTVYIEKLFVWADNKNKGRETIEVLDFFESDEIMEELEKLFFVDDLLGHIVAYWTIEDLNYHRYKAKFESLSPFFGLMFNILEDEDDKFIENFKSSFMESEESYEDRYGNSQHYSINFLFILLLCAMLNDRRNVIDHILSYNNFETVNLFFPPNMRTTETTKYVALKLLDAGDVDVIPPSWLTCKGFEEFLSSRIKHEDENLVSLDCSFLLHSHTKKCKVSEKSDVGEKLIFWEDTDILKFIYESDKLKHFISHPVIAEYLSLKSYKYREHNLISLLMFFIAICPQIVMLLWQSFGDPDTLSHFTLSLCSFMLFVLFEYCRYFWLSRHYFKTFLKKESSWTSLTLMFLMLFQIAVIWFQFEKVLLRTEFHLIFIALIIKICSEMLPCRKVQYFCILLRNFYYVAVMSLLLLLLSNYFENPDEISKYFESNHTQALTARITITLTFFLTTLAALKLTFTSIISNVKKHEKRSWQSTLEKECEQFIRLSKRIFLKMYMWDLEICELPSGLKWTEPTCLYLKRKIKYLIKTRLNYHPHIHKIDKIYVNTTTRKITLKFGEKLVGVDEKKISEKGLKIIKSVLGTK